jgi:hypothetical protein
MGDALAVQRGTYRRMVQRHLGQASSCVSYDRIARLAGPDRAFALFWIVRSTLCRTVTTRPITPEVYEALQHAYRAGLDPSSTSAPGGREVGQRVGHYVVEGGLFATLWQELEAGGFALRWESAEPSAALRRVRAAQRASKTRFRCPGCRANAWARPGTSLLCGRCSRHAVLVRLVDASNAMEHPRDERSVAPSRAYRVRQPSRVG